MTSIDIKTVQKSDISAPTFDLEKAEQDGKNVLFDNFRFNKKPLTIKFNGTLSTNGVNTTKFDDVENISFGILLEDEEVEGFKALEDVLHNYLVEKNLDDKYDITTPVKEDKLYVKLRYDEKNKKWPFKTNVAINQSNPQSANLFKGQGVIVTASCSVYLNTTLKKAGFYLTPTNLNFSK